MIKTIAALIKKKEVVNYSLQQVLMFLKVCNLLLFSIRKKKKNLAYLKARISPKDIS